MGERRVIYRVLVGKTNGRRPLGRPGVDVRLILKCIFNKWDAVHGLDEVSGTCECGNEPSGSIKCGEFLNSAPKSK
jgi:hypothetical protein